MASLANKLLALILKIKKYASYFTMIAIGQKVADKFQIAAMITLSLITKTSQTHWKWIYLINAKYINAIFRVLVRLVSTFHFVRISSCNQRRAIKRFVSSNLEVANNLDVCTSILMHALFLIFAFGKAIAVKRRFVLIFLKMNAMRSK